LLLAFLLFGDRFERGRELELVKVVTLRAGDAASETARASAPQRLSYEGPALFQASGWIEADPLPIRATTLYGGVVESVHVLEGQAVEEGQLLARMVDEDAVLDLRTARAALAEAEAGLERALAERMAAEAALAGVEQRILAAGSRLAELRDLSDRLNKAGPKVFRESEITQAGLRVETQAAVAEAEKSRKAELEAMLRRAEAALAAAEAAAERSRADLARQELALERTRILSPITGRIQRLHVAPGQKRMLAMDELESATIATLYRPDSLQARIDVPLEEAAQLSIGQPVRLRSSLLPDRSFRGRVTRIDGQADMQRNTLQAKVALLDPDDQLRPEMLCRAEFLAPTGAGERSAESSGRVALYLPLAALAGSGRERRVWALDASGDRVEQRSVTVGAEEREGHLRVLEGLRPGDWVVANPPADLEAGDPVKAPETEERKEP